MATKKKSTTSRTKKIVKRVPRNAAKKTKNTKTAKAAPRTITKRTTTNPSGPRTLTPYLAVNDATRAIEWYTSVLGAKEVSRTGTPDGKILHCELMLGDSRFMLSDIFPGSDMVDPKLTGATANLHVYSKDIDELFNRSVENGAEVTMSLENQFWGDRYGKVRDPFGHIWSFGYPAKMTKEEREQKEKQAMATFAAGSQR